MWVDKAGHTLFSSAFGAGQPGSWFTQSRDSWNHALIKKMIQPSSYPGTAKNIHNPLKKVWMESIKKSHNLSGHGLVHCLDPKVGPSVSGPQPWPLTWRSATARTAQRAEMKEMQSLAAGNGTNGTGTGCLQLFFLMRDTVMKQWIYYSGDILIRILLGRRAIYGSSVA